MLCEDDLQSSDLVINDSKLYLAINQMLDQEKPRSTSKILAKFVCLLCDKFSKYYNQPCLHPQLSSLIYIIEKLISEEHIVRGLNILIVTLDKMCETASNSLFSSQQIADFMDSNKTIFSALIQQLEEQISRFNSIKPKDSERVRDAKEYIESSISLIGYLSQMEVPVLEKMKHFGTLPVLKKAFGIKNQEVPKLYLKLYQINTYLYRILSNLVYSDTFHEEFADLFLEQVAQTCLYRQSYFEERKLCTQLLFEYTLEVEPSQHEVLIGLGLHQIILNCFCSFYDKIYSRVDVISQAVETFFTLINSDRFTKEILVQKILEQNGLVILENYLMENNYKEDETVHETVESCFKMLEVLEANRR